ncbi:MAG TPA: MYXO-CTERM sorting domain-containing protein [Kofleriaceae bacterium]
MKPWLLAIGIVASGDGYLALAAPICEYHGSYYDHGNWNYCQVEGGVPEGCPIHLVVRHGVPAVRATVMRGTATVDVTGATTANPVDHGVATLDVEACDCAAITVPTMFDETTLALVGAQAGDAVLVPDGDRVIGPAGPCPAVEWPQTFVERVACDICPTGPPSDPRPQAGGCAASGTPSWLAGALAVLGLGVRRRRRRRA